MFYEIVRYVVYTVTGIGLGLFLYVLITVACNMPIPTDFTKKDKKD